MTKQPKYINLSRAAVVGTLALIAVVVGPAQAHKTPVTAQQLQAYQEGSWPRSRRATCCSMATMPWRRNWA